MAPTIKINTNVAPKRTHPDDNEGGHELLEGPDNDDHPSLESGNTEDVPAFLCQPILAIHKKFEDLEWIQRRRISEGLEANDPAHRWALEGDPEVKARNRYANVQAWANSRIHLRVPEGECDFINASPIILKDTVSLQERRYIATQGPKLDNITHFWHMVFHESDDVGVIVMLTQTVEAGREKCCQYFPFDSENPTMILRREVNDLVVDDIDADEDIDDNIVGQVELLESTWNAESRSQVRKLQLTLGSESKIVWHFLFAGWADYSKPVGEDRDALLQLIKLSGSKCSLKTPRIVHCSAGVGRTGTFIALDHLLQELESGQLFKVTDPDTDPVFQTVDQMREQRMMMVYNEMQLIFIYEVLREQAELRLARASGVEKRKSEPRSAKIAKLSNEFSYLPAYKPELEAIGDRPDTARRSRSETLEVSENE